LIALDKIDEILAWEKTKERERDERFVELGQSLCEVRAGQYWRLKNLKSFDEFLEKRFPESRRKAYYLMAIREQFPRQVHRDLREVGWTEARKVVKVARAEGQNFDCAPWVHKAKQMPREKFKREVERHLTGKENEPWEMLYFKGRLILRISPQQTDCGALDTICPSCQVRTWDPSPSLISRAHLSSTGSDRGQRLTAGRTAGW
jgi:hypothetical protein